MICFREKQNSASIKETKYKYSNGAIAKSALLGKYLKKECPKGVMYVKAVWYLPKKMLEFPKPKKDYFAYYFLNETTTHSSQLLV